MMINELPKDFSSIATTFFEDYDNASRFAKDMEQNMKVLSGLDPLTTNKEVADYINDNNDKELLNGTEDALLQLDDRNAIELATQNMEALGVKKRVNPEISVYDYYTQNEIANKFADDTYRINFTNSKEDPSVYSTKYMIGSGKIYDALNSLKPNTTRLAMRYIGQPVVSLVMTKYGGVIGAGLSDAVMAGWDSVILGGTIYNTQKKYIDKYHQILGNSSLSLEQFTNELDNLLTEIQTDVAPEYQYEIFDGIIEGPNLFSDAGLAFTTFGIKTYVKSFEFLAKTAKRMLPSGSIGSSIKRMQMNEKLVEQIQKSMSNKVDESVVDEAISAKVEMIKPKEASETDIEMVKGIDKNKAVDRDLLQNSNNDSAIFDITVSQEDIAAHSANTSAENRSQAAEEVFNKRQTNYAMRETAGQKGEIKLERPQQVTVTRVGKGVNNDPMTWEEVQKWKKAEQGRANPITPWKGGKYGLTQYFEYNPDIEPELIGIQSASRTSWTDDINKPGKWKYREHQGEGAGDEWFFGGGYGSSIDSPWIAALESYYKDDTPSEVQKIDDIINRFHKDYISDEEFSKARKMFDKDNSIYQKFLDNERIFKEEDEAIESAIKSLRNNMERKYSIVKFLKDIGAKDETIDRIVDIENKFRGFNNDDIFQPNLIIDDIKQGLDEGPEHFNTIDSPDQLKLQLFKLISDYKKLIKNMKEEFPDRDLDTLIELYKDHFKKSGNYLPHSVEFSEFVRDLAFFNHQVIAEEFYKHLKSIMTAKDFVPKTAYLQTLGDINPMKNPKGILYYDNERGLIPFAELFNRANTEENYNKLLKIIQSDNDILDSIERDAAEGMLKRINRVIDLDNSVTKEAYENFIKDMKSNRDNITNWRSKLEKYIVPFDKNRQIATDINYNAWEQDYLERKGIKRLWHNGGASQSFNLSIQNFEDLTSVTLEESGIGTSWWTQIGYHNAHMIESAGDGVGYYGIIVHAPEGAKPIILKNGKIVDKGDWK